MVLSDPSAWRAAPTVLWVTPVGDLGGVARHFIDVARTGIPGYRIVFAVPPGPLAARLRDLGAAVQVAAIAPADGPATARRELRRIVATLRPAIVHTHLSFADIVAAAACWGLPPRLVSTEHGIAADDLIYHGSPAKSALMAAVHRTRTSRFALLLAVAEATAAAMRDKWHPKPPIRLLRNGVDRVNSGPRQAGLTIASIARLSPEKRIDRLVDAFALLAQRHPDARLILAGEGPLRAEISAQVSALGLQEVVDLPGYVDAEALLARTNVLAQLSVWENCSYSLLDATVRGIGVVATPVGGNPEILPVRCLCPADDPEKLAGTLLAQGRDLALRPALRPDWPSVAQMCQELADAYGEVTQ